MLGKRIDTTYELETLPGRVLFIDDLCRTFTTNGNGTFEIEGRTVRSEAVEMPVVLLDDDHGIRTKHSWRHRDA